MSQTGVGNYPKNRRLCSREEKLEAIAKAKELGTRKAAAALNICEGNINRWRNLHQNGGDASILKLV